ncbi:hypothetical protein L9F63_013591, partial [Diploptera punctata]
IFVDLLLPSNILSSLREEYKMQQKIKTQTALKLHISVSFCFINYAASYMLKAVYSCQRSLSFYQKNFNQVTNVIMIIVYIKISVSSMYISSLLKTIKDLETHVKSKLNAVLNSNTGMKKIQSTNNLVWILIIRQGCMICFE